MIVRLTFRQVGRVHELTTGRIEARYDDAFQEWWAREMFTASKHRVDMSMPAAAWKLVESVMFDHCFNERGFRSKDVRNTDLNALKSIRRALNARENHPALSKRGAIGLISEIIPAWKLLSAGPSGRWYSPYPVRGMGFTILAPESTVVRTKQTTLWVEADPGDRLALLDQAEHWRFVQ